MNITSQRLARQGLLRPFGSDPVELVRWMGAVQSQDYTAAKWALGLRLNGVDDAVIEHAFNEGTILRTHVLRPTWHFVAPEDLAWMLKLTGPRIYRSMKAYNQQTGLDQSVLMKSVDVLVKALEGGNQFSRDEIITQLAAAGLSTDRDHQLRFTHTLIFAELEGIICSGGRRGKQFTYALLGERAPNPRQLQQEEAVAELTLRYFRSHGPATVKDAAWWAGLPMGDIKKGIAAAGSQLVSLEVDGQTHWLSAEAADATFNAPVVHLLPNYDEYIVAYVDRKAIGAHPSPELLDSRGNVLFNHTIVIDGQITGTWKRNFKKKSVEMTMTLFRTLTAAEQAGLNAEIERFGQFTGLKVEFS